MQEARQRQVEIRVHDRDAGQRARRKGQAMEAEAPGDELLLLRPADRVVVVADQLDDRVVGLAAGIGEVDMAHRRGRDGLELLRQLAGLRRRLVEERVVVGHAPELADRGLDDRLLAEAERGAPHPGDALDVTLPVLVEDAHALARGDHQRRRLLERGEVAIAMDEIGGGARAGRILPCRHAVFPLDDEPQFKPSRRVRRA